MSSKPDLDKALKKTLGRSDERERFARAESYLENQASRTSIAPNTPVKKNVPARRKVIRDTFSFPEDEYGRIKEIRKRLMMGGHDATKGEVLRMGLSYLMEMNNDILHSRFGTMKRLKPGRPARNKD
ncbi:MAG: hypothetical protein U9N14_07280 [Pseudomonadota bacterium]|nr:hypothetical protein [Pseudomonadota bacterium]